jgi:glycosyltransferase involved in cell wall biosynthesis
MISDSELRSHRGLAKKIIKRLVIPPLLKNITGYLTVGDSNEDYYQTYGVSPLLFFRSPFPIDLDLYESAWKRRDELRRKLRASLEISEDKIVCSVVGKLEPRKRQQDILLALQRVQLPTRSIVLLLIGSGESESELGIIAKDNVEQNVVFAGFVEPSDLPSFYAATDIYIHPSNFDPHPLSISEAIYMGCPIIASQSIGSVGSSDDVQLGRNGLAFEPGNVKQLAILIERLVNNTNLRLCFGQNSHEIAEHNQKLANGLGLKSALTALGHLQVINPEQNKRAE